MNCSCTIGTTPSLRCGLPFGMPCRKNRSSLTWRQSRILMFITDNTERRNTMRRFAVKPTFRGWALYFFRGNEQVAYASGEQTVYLEGARAYSFSRLFSVPAFAVFVFAVFVFAVFAPPKTTVQYILPLLPHQELQLPKTGVLHFQPDTGFSIKAPALPQKERFCYHSFARTAWLP